MESRVQKRFSIKKMDGYLETLRKAGKSERTIRNYRAVLIQIKAKEDVKQWYFKHNNKANVYFVACNGYLNYVNSIKKHKYFEQMKSSPDEREDIRKKGEKKRLTQEQRNSIISKATEKSEELGLLARLLDVYGLRISGALGINLDSFKDDVILINSKGKTFPIPDVGFILELKAFALKKNRYYIFVDGLDASIKTSDAHKKIYSKYQYVRRQFISIFKELGLSEHIGTHFFRVNRVTDNDKKGISPTVTQKLMGWNSLQVYPKYVRMSSKEMQEEIKKAITNDKI